MRYYSVITLIFAWVDLRAARTSTLVAILETAGKESLSSRWNRSKLNKYVTLKLFASHSDIETIILLRTIREIYRVVVRMELSDDSDEYFEMLRLLTNFLHFEETSTKHDIPADATFAKRLFRCFYRRARCKRVFDTRGQFSRHGRKVCQPRGKRSWPIPSRSSLRLRIFLRVYKNVENVVS